MRQRIRTRPLASTLGVLAYIYTIHNGRKAVRGALADTPLGPDAEFYAGAFPWAVTAGSLYVLSRWRRNRQRFPIV